MKIMLKGQNGQKKTHFAWKKKIKFTSMKIEIGTIQNIFT